MVPVSDGYRASIYTDDRLLSARVDKLDFSGDGQPVYASFSGANTVQSITVKEAVNTGKSVSVGAACTAELALSLISYDDVLEEADFDGKTLLPYIGLDVEGTPEMVPCGVFIASEVKKETGGKFKIKGYDRMNLFDVDFSIEKTGAAWVLSAGSGSASLSASYTLADLLGLMCQLLGVEVESLDFPNAGYQPDESFAGTTTCRTVLSYIAQAAGGFARMTRAGKLQISWYTSAGITIGSESAFKVSASDFTAPAIDKLLVTAKDYDLGLSYGNGKNTYEIKDNPLLYSLTTKTAAEQQAVLAAIYDSISGISYQPVKFSAQGNPALQAGDIITFHEDARQFGGTVKTTTFTVPIMQRTLNFSSGMKDELESVGESASEKKPQTANDKIQALNRKSNVLERDLDKTRSEIQSIEGGMVDLRTEIEQVKDSVTISVENTGGSNLISNSVGKGGTVDWAEAQGVSTGDVAGTMSKFAFRIASAIGEAGAIVPGRLARTVDLVNGSLYTCSCKYRKDAAVAGVTVNGQPMEISGSAVADWKVSTIVIDLRGSTSTDRVVPISIAIDVSGGYLEVSDLMLCQGESTVWTQAPNEIYGAGYRFDKNGLTISNDGAETKLIADASGTRVVDSKTGDKTAQFTRHGTDTKQLHSAGEISAGQSGKIRMIPLESQSSVMWVIND